MRGRGLEQQLGAFARQGVVRPLGEPQRQDGGAQAPGQHPARQVGQHLVHGALDASRALLHAPAHQRQVVVLAAFVFPALEHGRQQIQLGQNVAQSCGEQLAALERAAQAGQRGVGQQRKAGGVAAQPAVVAGRRPLMWAWAPACRRSRPARWRAGTSCRRAAGDARTRRGRPPCRALRPDCPAPASRASGTDARGWRPGRR